MLAQPGLYQTWSETPKAGFLTTRLKYSKFLLSYEFLDGETEKDKAVVDMVLEQAYDLRNGVVRLCYNKDYVSGCLEGRRIAGSKVSYYQ